MFDRQRKDFIEEYNRGSRWLYIVGSFYIDFRPIRNKWICFRNGHKFVFSSHSLGGDWIRCERCHKLDEFLPGLHEPKGYK